MDAPPPPPPPHGDNPRPQRSGGLPDGKYDIFVIPPSSAGSGFLYLPSLQTQRNSFLAGCACTAAAFFLYNVALPVIRDWFYSTVNGGGSGLTMLVLGVAVVAWALGKTQGESGTGPSAPDDGRRSSHTFTGAPPPHSHSREQQAPPPGTPSPEPQSQPGSPPKPPPQSPPPKPKSSWQRPQPGTDGKTAWEKAREETRKKEEQRKKDEELKRRREELEAQRAKMREKEKLEKLEREWKEKKEAEEKLAKDAADKVRLQKEKEELERKLQRERERREREEREAKAKKEREDREAATKNGSPKRPPMPSARTARDDEDAYSFRPYDRPKSTAQKSSSGSVYSDDSYAPSATTAKTTPPASTRGPYVTKDPDKIIIKGVYSFNNTFMRTPVSQLISNQGNVTDGLILRITTEGLFIDDDVRGVPQREWDVKAWTMKAAEHTDIQGKHILRASIRDQEGKKYVFVLSQSEGWKVAVGLQKLRKGTQVRALNVAGLPANEARMLLETLGYG